MSRLISTTIACSLLFKFTAAVGAPTFLYYKQLAIDLAKAYIRWELRLESQPEVGEIDFRKPYIKATTDKAGRNFVFVGFPSSTTNWGAFATFQVCKSTPLLVPNESSTVNTFKAYWAATQKINSAVYVALPDTCPKDEN